MASDLADALAPVVLVVFFCVVASVVALVMRYLRSTGVERLQLKWLVASSVASTLMWLVAVFVLNDLAGEDAALAATMSFVLIPVGIGFAILRYRLFEIDRLVSRTVTYTLLVGVLGGVYLGGVLLIGGLFPQGNELAVAASTLAAAALFNPLRRRVQRGVDRRFNRSRYDVERELERFTSRLRDELDLDELTDDVIAVVTGTVQPTTVSVWTPPDGA